MKAVILAGGLGTRLKPFTEVIPKPLLPVGESSVLEIQINRFKEYGVDEIFIATNYMAHYVESFLGDGSKHGVKLHFSREEKPLGTCGPLALLKDQLTEPFFLINGDVLTTLDFRKAYNFGLQVDADLTVLTTILETPFHFGKVVSEGDYITNVEEKPDFRFEIIAGIYVIKPPVLDLIPEGEYFGIDSLIKKMLASDLNVAKYQMQEYWLDIGRINDYEAAQTAYKQHFKKTEE